MYYNDQFPYVHLLSDMVSACITDGNVTLFSYSHALSVPVGVPLYPGITIPVFVTNTAPTFALLALLCLAYKRAVPI